MHRRRRFSRTARLSISALGVALVLLTGAAWATGLVYLLPRAGLPSPLRLALVDTLHAYVGLASLAFIAAKTSRVGLRQSVPDVPGLQLWQRWLSWSLLVLYSAVYLTGLLLLPTWPRPVREMLANAHLLSSVWAAVPSSWHVWHYRPRVIPFLPRPGHELQGRFWLGIGIMALPVLVLGLLPRSLGPLSQSGNGSAWTALALDHTFVDRMQVSPDGGTLVAGGEGLYYSHSPFQQWHRIDFPPQLVLALTLPRGPTAIYVGTAGGLYAAPSVDGPYARLALPAAEVHAIAVDPVNASHLWVSSREGFFESRDGGGHWAGRSQGLQAPATAWAVTFFEGRLFGSDGLSVYRWDGTAWERSNHQPSVVSLDLAPDESHLFASSMGAGIERLDGQGWATSNAGLASHGRGSAIHIASVTPQDDMVLGATMLNGVAVSDDNGRSWGFLGAGLPAATVWRVLAVDKTLFAATDQGIFRFQLGSVSPASASWWTMLLAMVAVTSLAGLAMCAMPSVSKERRSIGQEVS